MKNKASETSEKTIYPTGTCFDDVADYINDLSRRRKIAELESLTICHGIAANDDGSIRAHAWLEHGEPRRVIDFGFMDGAKIVFEVPAVEYHPKSGTIECREYTIREIAMCGHLSENKGCGPWILEYFIHCGDAKREMHNFVSIRSFGKRVIYKNEK